MKRKLVIFVATSIVMFSGCESVNYVKSEVTGTAKPEGGILESVPASRTFSASAQAVRRATLQVLDDQGYVYEENSSTGTIKTEPKLLTDTSKFGFMGATYSAKLFIKLEGATVAYRVKFDKKSNLTMGGENVEFPEKEAELRKGFFAALDGKLSTSRSTRAYPVSAVTKAAAATPSPVRAEPASQKKTAQQVQQRKKTKVQPPVSQSPQTTEPSQKSAPIKVRSVTDL